MTKDSGRLEALVRGFRGRRVLVVADLVADEFVYGKVERISREAPVLILRHDATDLRLGGGANAVHNICSLGGRPVPFGVLGRDEPGRRSSRAAPAEGHPDLAGGQRGGLRDPGQDPHPGRARPLDQAADRPDRQGDVR